MTTEIDWEHPTDPRPGSWQLDHVRLYVGSNGAEGHHWNGTQTLLLTTVGRVSGNPVRTPSSTARPTAATSSSPPRAGRTRPPCGTGT